MTFESPRGTVSNVGGEFVGAGDTITLKLKFY